MGKIIIDGIEYGGSVDQVAYNSSDIADSQVTTATGWTTVDPLVSGETNISVFTKLSQMFKNVRWLYKYLNTPVLIAEGTKYSIYQCGKIVTVTFSGFNGSLSLTDLPKPANGHTVTGSLLNGTNLTGNFIINTSGSLSASSTTGSYGTISYITND